MPISIEEIHLKNSDISIEVIKSTIKNLSEAGEVILTDNDTKVRWIS